jgi:hypothetical protein
MNSFDIGVIEGMEKVAGLPSSLKNVHKTDIPRWAGAVIDPKTHADRLINMKERGRSAAEWLAKNPNFTLAGIGRTGERALQRLAKVDADTARQTGGFMGGQFGKLMGNKPYKGTPRNLPR